jgi:biotin carboxylase
VKRVLVAFPTAWDAKQLAACRGAFAGDLEVELGEPGHDDIPWTFDVVGFIERQVREREGRIHGVLSSSDYPGAAAAAAIARGLGLAGPHPEAVLRCAHKYYARLAQREAEPEATPPFALLPVGRPAPPLEGFPFPCFVKPVKGSFSVLARRVEDRAELEAFLRQPAVREFAELHMQMFDRLLAHFGGFEIDGGHFLAEGLLRGRLVTVEGFAAGGEVGILGVVDSLVDPGTGSFVRFDYPSALPGPVQERMAAIARRAIAALGLENSPFNVEMTWDGERDRIGIVEVNPRLCGQFADLYQKVDGASGYEIALALATGRCPAPGRRGGGDFRRASSFPLRTFAPARVRSAPDAARIAEVEREVPGALVWSECAPGQELADFASVEDGASARYGVVNLGADDEGELLARFERVRERLGFELEPL